MNKPILIFPAGMPRSLAFLATCLEQGRDVVGSSSLAFDPSRDRYPKWAPLPYVTDPTFDESLRRVIEEQGIGEIYTPNVVVWNYLDRNLARVAAGVTLANPCPVDEVLGGYRAALAKAKSLAADPLPLASRRPPRPMPSVIELAGLCRYADLVPGMCDDRKLHALLEIARHAVPGDVVEIGSWWGRSASILAWLARRFGIGNLLCVDPWSNAHLVQNESIVDSGSATVDADEALNVFQIGLLPVSADHVNYLRMTSAEGARRYAQERVVRSEHFGETRYTGAISILHVDGNHAYDAVRTDVDAWGRFVAGGGWIVLDDYLWPYGDGPRRIGDEFLAAHASRIATAFFTGGALFVQLEP